METMELTAAEAWDRILERARPLLPEHTYRIWLVHAEPLALSQDLLAVGAGSDFAAEWIEDKYGALLQDVARKLFGRPITISFQHQAKGGGRPQHQHQAPSQPARTESPSVGSGPGALAQPVP